MYDRHIKELVRTALKDTRVVAIAGPRQSGKTTLVKEACGKTHAYVTLDDEVTFRAAESDPIGFIQQFDKVIIDEIQRVPKLSLAIKMAVDANTQPGRFLITGSADITAMPRAVESLAGRIEIINLLPLSQAEISGSQPAAFLEKVFEGFPPKAQSVSADTLSEVFKGGFPEARQRTTDTRRMDWHRNFTNTLLDRDLRDLAVIEQTDRVPQLFQLLATRSGQLVNWESLASDAKMNARTLERYVRLIEQIFLIKRLPAWSTDETQRLVSTPKLHFMDSGLLASTLGISLSRLGIDRSPVGPILECFVFTELMKMLPFLEQRTQLFHYRDKDQAEVDFVLENTAGEVVGIEVKAARTITEKDFRGLHRLAGRARERFRSGILLYDGPHTLPFGNRLFAAPVSSLWTT